MTRQPPKRCLKCGRVLSEWFVRYVPGLGFRMWCYGWCKTISPWRWHSDSAAEEVDDAQ